MRTASSVVAPAVLIALSLGAAPAEAATKCPFMAKAGNPYKVEFATGSSTIDAKNEKTVDTVAGIAKARYLQLCLVGRADKTGNDKANYALSVRRAEAVASALVKRGVQADRITVVGRGEAFGDWFSNANKSQADRTVDISLGQ